MNWYLNSVQGDIKPNDFVVGSMGMVVKDVMLRLFLVIQPTPVHIQITAKAFENAERFACHKFIVWNHVVVMWLSCGVQSEEEEQRHLARHGADLTPSPRTGAIVDELLQGVVSDNLATGDSSTGAPGEAQPQPQPHAALLPDSEPKPLSPGALQGQWPLDFPIMVSMLFVVMSCDDQGGSKFVTKAWSVAYGAEFAFSHLHALPSVNSSEVEL